MKTMPVREFLRGGYQDIRESTLVMKHGQPMFTVIPQKKRTSKDGSKEEPEARRA